MKNSRYVYSAIRDMPMLQDVCYSTRSRYSRSRYAFACVFRKVGCTGEPLRPCHRCMHNVAQNRCVRQQPMGRLPPFNAVWADWGVGAAPAMSPPRMMTMAMTKQEKGDERFDCRERAPQKRSRAQRRQHGHGPRAPTHRKRRRTKKTKRSDLQQREEERDCRHFEQLPHAPVQDPEVRIRCNVLRTLAVVQNHCGPSTCTI
jgi:hypothetical protein